jgi:hypothetical protein
VSAPKGTCVDCGGEVLRIQTAVYEVRGYERERDRGGANHVLERVRVDGRVWHEHCFPAWLRRQHARGEQGVLL